MEDRYAFEIVLVNDGSRDASLETMKLCLAGEPRLRIVDLARNYGQTAALQAGLDAARGEILVTLDADLQHFPEEIPRFLEQARGRLRHGLRLAASRARKGSCVAGPRAPPTF